MIDRDPERVEYLIKGLMQNPYSLYRAEILRTTQVPPGMPSQVLDWYGYTPTVGLLRLIYNFHMTQAGGNSAAQYHLKPPDQHVVVRPGDLNGLARAMGG